MAMYLSLEAKIGAGFGALMVITAALRDVAVYNMSSVAEEATNGHRV